MIGCHRTSLLVSERGVVGKVSAVGIDLAMGVVERHSKMSAGRKRVLWALAAAVGLFAAGSARADMVALSASLISPFGGTLLPAAGSALSPPQAAGVETSHSLSQAKELAETASAVDALLRLPPSPAFAFGQPTTVLPDGVSHEQPGTPAVQKVDNLPASPSSLTVALSSLLTLGSWRLVRQARQVHLVCLPEWYHDGGPGQVGHATPLELNKSLNLLLVYWYQPEGVGASAGPTAHYSQPERCSAWHSLYFIPTSAPRSPPICL